MSHNNDDPLGNREAKILLIIIFVFAPLLGIGLLIPVLLHPLAYCLLFVLCGALCFVVKLARIGNAATPRVFAVGGIGFIVAGGAFDMAATVYHSPSLSAEGNPVVRVFLDAGYRIGFIYLYAFLAQSLFFLFLSFAWIAFLKHRNQLISSIGHPTTMVDFLQRAFGTAHLSRRKWWSLSIRASELPHAYHTFWFMTVLFMASMLDSWYLGLKWFNLVHGIRWYVVSAAVGFAMVIYFIWLWCSSRRVARP